MRFYNLGSRLRSLTDAKLEGERLDVALQLALAEMELEAHIHRRWWDRGAARRRRGSAGKPVTPIAVARDVRLLRHRRDAIAKEQEVRREYSGAGSGPLGAIRREGSITEDSGEPSIRTLSSGDSSSHPPAGHSSQAVR